MTFFIADYLGVPLIGPGKLQIVLSSPLYDRWH